MRKETTVEIFTDTERCIWESTKQSYTLKELGIEYEE